MANEHNSNRRRRKNLFLLKSLIKEVFLLQEEDQALAPSPAPQQQQQQQNNNRRYDFNDPIPMEYKSGKFDLEKYLELKTISERLKYVRAADTKEPAQFQQLGLGSSRVVYRLPQIGKVIKLAINKAGIDQNKEEIKATRKIHQIMPEYPIVTKIFGHDDINNPTWLISEAVSQVEDESEIEDMAGVPIRVFYQIVMHGLEDTTETAKRKRFADAEVLNVLQNPSPLLKAVSMIHELGLDAGDLTFEDHWGVTADHRLVALDYGFPRSVADKYNAYDIDNEYMKPF